MSIYPKILRFHAFHANSKRAYTWLRECRVKGEERDAGSSATTNDVNDEPDGNGIDGELERRLASLNMGQFQMSPERSSKVFWENFFNRNFQICQSFAQLRTKVRDQGLLNADNGFFMRKILEAIGLICLSLFFHSVQQFTVSALFMGLAWQQLGWMIHEVIFTFFV